MSEAMCWLTRPRRTGVAEVVLDGIDPGDIVERPTWHRDALCVEQPSLSCFPGPGIRADLQRAM